MGPRGQFERAVPAFLPGLVCMQTVRCIRNMAPAFRAMAEDD